jgi:hypothetical protein
MEMVSDDSSIVVTNGAFTLGFGGISFGLVAVLAAQRFVGVKTTALRLGSCAEPGIEPATICRVDHGRAAVRPVTTATR